MKKLTKFAFSLVLALVLVLALAVCAHADDSLPKERVSYGYGAPEAAGVDMHGLLPENITVDGVALDIRCENGKMYLRLTDLASAKLLRDSADKAAELGLDYSTLYISDGVILVREDGLTADEIADIQAKLSELTRDAEIKLTEGDAFAFSNGGETALIVEFGGFIMPPASEKEAEVKAEAEAAPVLLDVKAANAPKTADGYKDYSLDNITVPNKTNVSTVYISYCGVSVYNGNNTLQSDSGVTTSAWNMNRSGYVFLVKAEDDTNDYFICVSYGDDDDTPPSYTQMHDAGALSENETMTENKEAFSIVEVSDKSGDAIAASETGGNTEKKPDENSSQYKLAQTITIATDEAGQNVVKTINLKDGIGDLLTFSDIDVDENSKSNTATINGEKGYSNGGDDFTLMFPTGDNVDIEVTEPTEGAPAADSVPEAPEVDATVWDVVQDGTKTD